LLKLLKINLKKLYLKLYRAIGCLQMSRFWTKELCELASSKGSHRYIRRSKILGRIVYDTYNIYISFSEGNGALKFILRLLSINYKS
jgi:hypothetical protein